MERHEHEKDRLKERINKNFKYYPPNEEQIDKYISIRNMCKNLSLDLVELCPPSKELNEALTNMENVVFWANSSISRKD